jgi:MFS family permease
MVGGGTDAASDDAAQVGNTGVLVLLAALGVVSNSFFATTGVTLARSATQLGFSGTGLALVAGTSSFIAGIAVFGAGEVGDRWGLRRSLILGAALMALAGLTCGLPTGAVGFVFGQGLSGLAGALLATAGTGMLRKLWVGPALGVATGRWMAIGATLGSAMTLAGLGFATLTTFRAAFLTSAATCALVGLAAARWLPRVDARLPANGGFDFAGVSLAAIAMGGMLWALASFSGGDSFPATVIGLSLAVGAGAALVVVERGLATPAVPIGLLRRPVFLAATLVGVVTGLGTGTLVLQLSNVMQFLYGYSEVGASLALLPYDAALVVFAVVAGALLAGSLLGRGARAGTLFVIGLLAISGACLVVTAIGPNGSFALFVVAGALGGFGLAISRTPQTAVMLSVAPARMAGSVSAFKAAATRFGSSLGAAIVVPIVSHAAGSDAHVFVRAAEGSVSTADPMYAAYHTFLSTRSFPSGPVGNELLARANQYLDGISLAMTIIAGALVLSAVAIAVVARGSRGSAEASAEI